MDSPTLVDSTIEPTNETQSVYVDVTGIDDMNGSGPVSVDVSITGLNASDDTLNGTTVDSQTLCYTQGNVSTYDYTLNQSDIDDYDELQIDSSVVTDGDESLIDSVDWGSLVENAGGAGGGPRWGRLDRRHPNFWTCGSDRRILHLHGTRQMTRQMTATQPDSEGLTRRG